MVSLVYSTDLEGSWDFQPPSPASETQIGFPSFFQTIPPERIGLNGEYDHSGLAKRVDQALRKQFNSLQLEKLRITQRGRVVILAGQVLNQPLLDQMVSTALNVIGATNVETYGVSLVERAGI